MFEEASNAGFCPDIVGKARNLWPEAAYAAHHQINLDTLPAGFIQRVDNLRIDQRINLHPYRGGTASLRVLDFLGYVLQDTRTQRDR